MWLITPLPHPGPQPQPNESAPAPKVEYLATLARHSGVVNAVRFCPAGEKLASAGDDGNLLIWALSEEKTATAAFGEDPNEAQYAKEVWKIKRACRVTPNEIYDLAWSPDGQWILCGSTDNVARFYNANDGSCHAQISDHANYVQGVSWDPLNQFVATQSSDRHMHVYGLDIRQNELHYNLIGKNSKMDVLHKSTASWANATESETETEGPEASTSRAPTEEFRRPQPKRSASRASDSSEASSFRKEYGGASAESRHTSAFDVDETPMDPPARASSPSRRSSVSSAHASPSANHTRVARSPSPMPPLPAIRVPTASTSSNTLHVKSLHQQEEQQRFTTHLYGDQEASPFFRRLAWSPDGALLLTPAGIFDDPFAVGPGSEATSSKPKKKSSKKGSLGPKPTVYIYSRANIGRPPVAHLPGHKSASIAIRFNPVLWELRTEEAAKSNPAKTVRVDLEVGVETSVEMGSASAAVKGKALKGAFDLPHRMIYAIATHESVYVYDTQQAGPLCMFGNLHYAPFTDVTWSADGQTLVLANQDGYCSIVAFEAGELGTPLPHKPAGIPPVVSHPTPSTSAAPSPVAATKAAPALAKIEATKVELAKDGGEPVKKKRRVELKTQPLDGAPASAAP